MQLRWLAAFLAILIMPGFSQETSPDILPTSTPEPPSRVLFSVYTWSNQGILRKDSVPMGVPRIFYDAPVGMRSVKLVKGASTPLYPYQGPQPLTLYDWVEVWTPPAEDAPPGTGPTVTRTRKPIVNARFAPGMDRVLVVMFLGQKNPDGTLKSVVLPYHSEKLKPGMTRIFNGSDKRLALKFADTENGIFRLEPNSVFDFTPSEITSSEHPRIFLYDVTEEGKLRGLHTNRLFLKDKSVNMFLIYPEGIRRVRLQRLGDHPGADTDSLFPPEEGERQEG